jgi:hypothetical protein
VRLKANPHFKALIDGSKASSLLVLAAVGLTLVAGPSSASATPKQAIAYFGSESGQGSLGGQFFDPGDIAVNSSGAGPAGKGDIYVVDEVNDRIERFAQNDNGTPANPYDDTYPFISAWGSGVDSTFGGDNYEICTVAASCRAGLASGGNGSAAGDGGLGRFPQGIAVDQDTGDVYVTDAANARINVYTGDGTFLRSFGWDVVESGPDNAGTGFEVCIAANGDVCKAGVFGSGIGQLSGTSGQGNAEGIAISPSDGNAANGTVFLADHGNRRVDTYSLDGSSPSSFGSAANFTEGSPLQVAVDSRGIVYASGRANNGQINRYDSQNADGGGVGFLAPILAPPLSLTHIQPEGLKVDSDSDGAGPETDVLYVLRDIGSGATVVQQFGPVNEPGLTAPPAAEDEEHGALAGFNHVSGLALDESSGRLFISTAYDIGPSTGQGPNGVYVLDKAGVAAASSLESLSAITATSVVLHGKVNPNGPPDVSYHAEYSPDGIHWTGDPNSNTVLGSQETAQSVSATLDPPGGGLEPNTLYHVRLVATRPFNPPVPSSELTFTTSVAPPLAETTGSPVRTATTARLEGRVDPSNSPTSFHFEYGTEGPCNANPCTATGSEAAGSEDVYELTSQPIAELQPNTTYHYRIVADNGNPGSPVFGEDMIVTTRATDALLSHGHFPGPPGSDRAYEQVNLPDTGGNPLNAGVAFSDNGNRAVYITSGGNPSSPVGGFTSQFFAERGASGWKSVVVMPPRSELAGSQFQSPSGPSDLSSFALLNLTITGTQRKLWRLMPDGSPQKLFELAPPEEYGNWYVGADDSTRVVTQLRGGTLDPAYPAATSVYNLYDVSNGTPKLVSLLPGNTVSPCAVGGSTSTSFGLGEEVGQNPRNWISADGKELFFPGGCGTPDLYMREFETEQTKLVSGPPLSGSDCGAILIKSTAGAAFFWTQTRLTADDTNPSSCDNSHPTDGDVYRYDIADGALKCVTCVASGLDADVYPGPLNAALGVPGHIAIAEDGSRVYFQSPNRLLRGAPASPEGGGTIYRVDVPGGGDLRWIAGPGVEVGDEAESGTAINRDGSAVVFRAKGPSLNPQGEGTDNGGTYQYYLYTDTDRSLICVSCSADGSASKRDVPAALGKMVGQDGANTTPLADDGTLAFPTSESLVGVDQNTAGVGQDPRSGTDVYEWRDGRALLITDGLTNWPRAEVPELNGVSPSGHDVFFTAATQYTPDAIDGYRRLYDARIGGGFEFPPPPKPCPLEVCQGTPKGAPEEQPPGTGSFTGPGNAQQRARGKKKAHKKSHKKHQHKTKRQQRAGHDGRAGR